jgi:hypothetical protein
MDYDGPIRRKIDKSGICDQCGCWDKDVSWEKEKPGLFRYKIMKVCYDCKFDRK